jgi:UDP-N-acetylmuramyl tripeptide synthase
VSSGAANFTGCTIDKASMGYQLTASSGALSPATSNTFTINAGTAAALNIVSGNNQSATVSTAFANPLVVIVTDANGNPVSGAQVTFQVVPASGGASATFAAKGCSSSTKSPVCVVTTKSTGQATTSTFTANGTAGSYTIVATTPSAPTLCRPPSTRPTTPDSRKAAGSGGRHLARHSGAL